MACGEALAPSCAGCGATLPAGARFCPACGAAAEVPAASPRTTEGGAERRSLTVLFTDLVDSASIASELDLEDWTELAGAYQRMCSEAIERFEGHVAQYLGDGLVAYFGYPQAHEDAAERAVRAGLQIARGVQRTARSGGGREGPLAVRIGIHTGPVVVGEVGGGRRRETLAVGETANIAARLQGIAAPNTVVLSEDTLRLVGGIFVTEDLGSPPLKGVSRRIRLHRAVRGGGVRGRLSASARSTPFVGRDLELGLLRDRWQRALEGEGQSVLVSGPAGMGKSRLVLALREGLAEEPHLWLECGASPYRRDSAFHPVVELIERGLAFGTDDDPQARLRRLDAALERVGIDWRSTLLAELLELSVGEGASDPGSSPAFDPDLRRARTIEALTTWALALAEGQPVLLLIEDLQWADPSTLDLLGGLIDQIPTGRLLMVMTARPEFAMPWTFPKNFSLVALDRLRRRQARELVASLRPPEELGDEAIERIVERADGIPLFLEELVDAAAGSRGQAVRIPATLQDSLMARLDRLGPAKELAQLASVLGREFGYQELAAAADLPGPVLEEHLGRMVAADLVLQRGAPPASSYVFRHALIREAAYESLLRAKRRELHARAAAALEELHPDAASGEPEILARHYEEAGQAARAIACHRQAGRRATARSAFREAERQLRRGLELLGELPVGPTRDRAELELLISLGPAINASAGSGDPETGRIYMRARELCEPGAAELSHVLSGLFSFHLNQGDLERAFALAEEQLAFAKETDDPAAQMRARWSLGQALCVRGEPASAASELQRALQLFDPARDRILGHDRADPGVAIRSWRSWALWLSGASDRAWALSDEAVELARKGGHPYSLAYALGFAAVLGFMRRDRESAAERARETIHVSAEGGFPVYRAVGELVRIWGEALNLADHPESMALVERFRGGIRTLSGMSSLFGRPLSATGLAEILRDSSQVSPALSVIEETLEFTRRSGVAFWDAELVRLRAELLLAEGERDAAAVARTEQLLERALETTRAQGAHSLELRVATSLATLWLERGERRRCLEILAPLDASLEEGADTPDREAARAILASCTDPSVRHEGGRS